MQILYNNAISAYNLSGQIQSQCAEITFINNGNTNIVLNNSLVIPPTGSISFDGKQYELDVTVYNIIFDDSNVVSPDVPFPNCVVIRKYYNTYAESTK